MYTDSSSWPFQGYRWFHEFVRLTRTLGVFSKEVQFLECHICTQVPKVHEVDFMMTSQVAWFPEDLDRCETTIEAWHQKSSSEISWDQLFGTFGPILPEIPSICLRKGSIPDHIVEKAPAMRHLKSERDTWRATLPSDWYTYRYQAIRCDPCTDRYSLEMPLRL